MTKEIIVSKTPLRVSFVGGGTDVPDFYTQNGGAVVSSTIDKYIYLIIHSYFDPKFLLKYSSTELVDKVDDVKHPLIRECLRYSEIQHSLELTSFSDLPPTGGSGLGSSSAFTVGLLNALNRYNNINKPNYTLAEKACEIEIDILKSPIGKQDQYSCAIGGFNLIEFNQDGSVKYHNLHLTKQTIKKLHNNLLMFYTGVTRSANTILKEQNSIENLVDKKDHLLELKDLAYTLAERLYKNDTRFFGEALHRGWELKKLLSNNISNNILDDYYTKALNLGAIGGKILGAGGGGFFLFYCPEEKQESLIKNLGLQQFKFEFTHRGSDILLR